MFATGDGGNGPVLCVDVVGSGKLALRNAGCSVSSLTFVEPVAPTHVTADGSVLLDLKSRYGSLRFDCGFGLLSLVRLSPQWNGISKWREQRDQCLRNATLLHPCPVISVL